MEYDITATLEEDTWDTGLEELEVYITRRHNMVAQYIKTYPILYLCGDV